MNTVYGAIVGTTNTADDYFNKRHTNIKLTDKGRKIQSIIRSLVPADTLALFACVISYTCLHSIFGSDIAALDPENTYEAPRYHDSLLAPGISYQSTAASLYPYLDTDIRNRLIFGTWYDLLAAGVLQMLRG